MTDKDPISEIKPIESILNQTLYVTQSPQQFRPESNLPTYQITTEEQRKKQLEKPPIRGEVYVFENKHDKNTSIDIRIYTPNKVEILNVINFIKQYLSQFEINHDTNVIIVIGEGRLILSYQELQAILSDSEQALEKIGDLPRKGEILAIESVFDRVVKEFLEKTDFLINYYKNPEETIALIRERINSYHNDEQLSLIKSNRLEELIQNLRQKLDRIKSNIDPQKALEILSLTEEEIEERIQQLPAIPNHFYEPLIHFSEQSILAQIDPSNIISAESKNTDTPGDTWWHYYIRRGNNEIPYQKSLIISFLNGKYPFLENQAIEKESDPITLIHIGNGKYIASNGRHRIIAAKLIGAKSICCQVYELPVKAGEKRKINPNNLYYLNYLISKGKIKGHIEEIEENGDNFFYIIFDEPSNPIYLFKDPNLASSIINSEK